MGRIGIVESVDEYYDVTVRFGSRRFKFNPECLNKTESALDQLDWQMICAPENNDLELDSGFRGSDMLDSILRDQVDSRNEVQDCLSPHPSDQVDSRMEVQDRLSSDELEQRFVVQTSLSYKQMDTGNELEEDSLLPTTSEPMSLAFGTPCSGNYLPSQTKDLQISN